MKENFKIPLNIPVSKKAIHVLRGLLEKNPSMRIELSSPLIIDWLEEDNVKLNYNRKKCDEDNENSNDKYEKTDNIHENIISKKTTINKNDKILDNNDQFNEDDIIREFAKFDIKDEDDNKNGHKDNFGSHSNHSHNNSHNNHNINKKPLKSAKTSFGGTKINSSRNVEHKDFSKSKSGIANKTSKRHSIIEENLIKHKKK